MAVLRSCFAERTLVSALKGARSRVSPVPLHPSDLRVQQQPTSFCKGSTPPICYLSCPGEAGRMKASPSSSKVNRPNSLLPHVPQKRKPRSLESDAGTSSAEWCDPESGHWLRAQSRRWSVSLCSIRSSGALARDSVCVQNNSFSAHLVWQMEELGSGAGKMLSHTAAGMPLR